MRKSFAIAVVAAIAVAHAQADLWPSFLVVPEASSVEDDSNVASIVVRQWLYDKSFRGTSQGSWQYSDSISYWKQTASYDLTYDHGAFGDVINQYLDMTGCVFRKRFPTDGFLAGCEWKPVLMLNSRERSLFDSGVFQGDFAGGPFISFPLFGAVPLKLGVGAGARVWNMSAADRLFLTAADDFNSAGGFYVSGSVGQWERGIGEVPLHFEVRGEGRAVGETERLMSGLGSLFYAFGFPSADSIFFFIADSAVNGKRASLSESAEGKISFVHTPSRIENSLRLEGGVRLKPRFRFAPSVEYAYLDHSRQYPWNRRILSDVRRTQKHELRFGLTSDDFVVDYRGGLRVSWEREDWVFDRTVETLNEKLANINDQKTFRAEMVHEASRNIVAGLGLRYRYAISRELRLFEGKEPFGRDTLHNNGDHDEVLRQHELETHFIRSDLCSVSVFYVNGFLLSRYLKKERSADNSTDRRHKIGLDITWYGWERLIVREVAGIAAEIGRHQYPAFHIAPEFDPAPYKRRFYSRLTFLWHLCGMLDTRFGFDWRYNDNGYWNGRELYDSVYLDTTTTEIAEYYAPQFKSLETSIEASPVLHFFDGLDVEGGAVLKYIRLQEFLHNAYQVVEQGGGYWLIPFLRVRDTGRSVPWQVAGTVKAYVDVKRRASRVDAWEVDIELNVGF